MSPPSKTRSTTLAATDEDVRDVETFLRRFPELAHLRVRRRAALLTLESGDPSNPLPHARLRRLATKVWQLEMANHMGRWQPTPFHGPRDEILGVLVGNFGWTLVERI
jgi:hypothetical protein